MLSLNCLPTSRLHYFPCRIRQDYLINDNEIHCIKFLNVIRMLSPAFMTSEYTCATSYRDVPHDLPHTTRSALLERWGGAPHPGMARPYPR